MSSPPPKRPRLIDTSIDLFTDSEPPSKIAIVDSFDASLETSGISSPPPSNLPRVDFLNETHDLFEYPCATQRARPAGPVSFASALERVTYDPEGKPCDFKNQPRFRYAIPEPLYEYNPELNRAFVESSSDESVIHLE